MPPHEIIELSSDDEEIDPVAAPTRAPIEYPPEDLQIAIRSVSSRILQDSVIQLCWVVPGAKEYLSAALLTPTRKGAKRGKQKTRWVKCANCEEDFDLSAEGDDDECIYHSGGLEPDDECWPDHDERCHGPIDTDDNRRDFPESFEWSCCETNGAALYHHSDVDSTDEDYDEERFGAGCQRGRHREESMG